MQCFMNLLIFYRRSTCFRRFLCSSSGAHNCTYNFRYCQTTTAASCYCEWDGTQSPQW